MLGNLELANAIAELRNIERETLRAAEKDAAQVAESRDYKIDPDSLAALERGDRQRETGDSDDPLWERLVNERREYE